MFQFSTLARDAILDAMQDAIGDSAVVKFWTGPKPATCAAADTGTMIAELALASSWGADASAGVKSFSLGRLVAVASGALGYFRIYASDGLTCHMQGTITEPGGSGDIIIDGIDMAWGQGITVAGFTITAPGG